jgi:hypothetical protein
VKKVQQMQMLDLFSCLREAGIAEIVYFLQDNGGLADQTRKIVQNVHDKIVIQPIGTISLSYHVHFAR